MSAVLVRPLRSDGAAAAVVVLRIAAAVSAAAAAAIVAAVEGGVGGDGADARMKSREHGRLSVHQATVLDAVPHGDVARGLGRVHLTEALLQEVQVGGRLSSHCRSTLLQEVGERLEIICCVRHGGKKKRGGKKEGRVC